MGASKYSQEKVELLTYEEFAEYLRRNDPPSFFALNTLRKMRGQAVLAYAKDIFDFLNYRQVPDAFDSYVKRSESLRILQTEFARVGRYRASSSRDVTPIDSEQYKLALLLSFVGTSHRFDILQSLVRFLRMRCEAPPEFLSIGYGSGYEVKLALQEMPDWRGLAFDNSIDCYQYAGSLLSFFGYSTNCLRQELFPLEVARDSSPYRKRFGKVIACELLEHLDDPESAMRAIKSFLHPGGLLFCTMAINIAQEDHVYLYPTIEHARLQVLDCGFEIVEEIIAPCAILPFEESQRLQSFKNGNYICVLRPA